MAEASKALVWDQTGDRLFETGVSKGVLFPADGAGGYAKGVVWNGLTGVTEKPSGADATPLYADNIKYLSLTAAEEFGATIEAYTYPDEFAVCDGSAELAAGITVGQQARKTFGLVYVTAVGNDVDDIAYGYKIHVIYGAKAAPSERGFKTINDKPEAIAFSWTITTTPANVTGHKPTASLVIDSTKVDADSLAAIEALLFGSDLTDASLPTPDEILALVVDLG
jgi:hypothetical protein